jgi:hypothetical protein
MWTDTKVASLPTGAAASSVKARAAGTLPPIIQHRTQKQSQELVSTQRPQASDKSIIRIVARTMGGEDAMDPVRFCGVFIGRN